MARTPIRRRSLTRGAAGRRERRGPRATPRRPLDARARATLVTRAHSPGRWGQYMSRAFGSPSRAEGDPRKCRAHLRASGRSRSACLCVSSARPLGSRRVCAAVGSVQETAAHLCIIIAPCWRARNLFCERETLCARARGPRTARARRPAAGGGGGGGERRSGELERVPLDFLRLRLTECGLRGQRQGLSVLLSGTHGPNDQN